MLAKIIVHAPSRREASLRLARVLEETRVQGMVTNRDFLVQVLRNESFLAGDTTTNFLDRVTLSPNQEASKGAAVDAAIALALTRQYDRRAGARQLRSFPSGWRNTPMPPQELRLSCNDSPLRVCYQSQRDGSFRAGACWDPEAPSHPELDLGVKLLERTQEGARLEIDGRQVTATVTRGPSPELDCVSEPLSWFVHCGDRDHTFVEQPRFPLPSAGDVAGGLVAPMPGNVVSCEVEVGQEVEQGQLLVVLEAMKMEHRIVAPENGRVTEVRVAAGDQVANGALLVVVESADS